MKSAPRVVVIDDELPHLAGLADTLEHNGVACHRIHYTGDPDEVGPCPDVRLVIADLHLGSGVLGTDPTTDFSVIGALLEDAIRPTGPYSILLWTMYPDFAPELQIFLRRLRGVPRPVEVTALAKVDYLDNEGRVRDEKALNSRIDVLADGWMRPEGALALIGAWSELSDEEMDELIEEIYAARWRGLDDQSEERRD